MEDIVEFKRRISNDWRLEGPWVIFGCSYAGLLVTWLKRLYPHEFVGAVVSSAPIEAKVFISARDIWGDISLKSQSFLRPDIQSTFEQKV